MKKVSFRIVILLTAITSFIVIAFSFVIKDTNKVAFIDLNKVFSKFEFKMELEKKALKISEVRTHKLDSLELELKILMRQIQNEKGENREKVNVFQEKKEYFYNKKKEFEQSNNEMIQQYDAQILKQLTQYVKDYGSDHDFNYILGSDESGIIMYSRDANDITEDVIKYINIKYRGLK